MMQHRFIRSGQSCGRLKLLQAELAGSSFFQAILEISFQQQILRHTITQTRKMLEYFWDIMSVI